MKAKTLLVVGLLVLALAAPVMAPDTRDCSNADVVLVIDRSGSMSGTRLTQAKAAAVGFVDNLQLGSGDKAASVSFASGSSIDQSLTTDGNAVKSAINGLSASGSTCISCGLVSAQNELDANGRSGNISHVIVLLSDGAPNFGDDVLSLAAASNSKSKGVVIFSIGIAAADPTLMQNIASSPNSPYYSTGSEGDLDDIYDEIATQICEGADEGIDIPEFGLIGAGLALAGVGLFLWRRR